jgi:hypothetical protein
MRFALASLLVAGVFTAGSGCSHTMTIDSDPVGAEVKVNGDKLGVTPVNYTEQTGWEKVMVIEMTKPGYKTYKREHRQNEWNIPVVAGVAVGSICLGTPVTVVGAVPLIGLLWSRQMPDRLNVSLEKGSNATESAPPPSQYGY